MKYGISTLLGLILLSALGIAVFQANPKIRSDPDSSMPSHDPMTVAAILVFGYGGVAAVLGALLGMITWVLRGIVLRRVSNRQSD